MISATQIKVGNVIILNGDLYRVMTTMHVAPGNWRAMIQTKMRNLRNGSQLEHRFSSNDKVEKVILDQQEMEYLYNDGDQYHFMNTATFEQVAFTADDLGDVMKYLIPNGKVMVDLHEGRPIGVSVPKFMTFKVIEADPSVKRATASAQFKNATIESGVVFRVPSFVEAGDTIKVDTETGEYLERV